VADFSASLLGIQSAARMAAMQALTDRVFQSLLPGNYAPSDPILAIAVRDAFEHLPARQLLLSPSAVANLDRLNRDEVGGDMDLPRTADAPRPSLGPRGWRASQPSVLVTGSPSIADLAVLDLFFAQASNATEDESR
jgi:hypothetical protein